MHERIFNIHDFILIMTTVQATFLAALLLFSRVRSKSQYYLAGFLLAQGSLSIYLMFLYGDIFLAHTQDLLAPYQGLPLIAIFIFEGPLLYWYTTSLIYKDMVWTRYDNVPIYLLIAIYCMLLTYLPGLGAGKAGLNSTLVPQIFGQVLSVFYGFYALRQISNYNSRIKHHYSNIDEINLRWLRVLIVGFMTSWILRLSSYPALLISGSPAANILGLIPTYLILLLINLLVFVSLKYTHTFMRSSVKTHMGELHGKTVVAFDELSEKLEMTMLETKPFLIPNINLDKLASILGVSSRTLSNLINRHYNKNFFEYINNYRIEEAKRLLADADNSGKPIQAIFEAAGFNSKSTFNDLFKDMVGCTPTDYRKTHCRKKTVTEKVLKTTVNQ